jgi:FKBP-type peptidyl-prolyl cis-trans isomerase
MFRVTCLLILSTASAFAPTAIKTSRVQLNQMFSFEAPALETVPDSSDPFESYDATSPSQKTIAIKDISLGSGSEVSDAKTSDSQLLQLQYTAKLMNSKFSANLKQFDTPSMVFQTGQQRCLPGLEEGIIGMKVGGRRLVRVPPNKGYGANWYRGVVPPDSHLEFDVTVVNVASGPVEEFQMKLEQFGVERALGAAVCLGYLALSPLIEKSGIFG